MHQIVCFLRPALWMREVDPGGCDREGSNLGNAVLLTTVRVGVTDHRSNRPVPLQMAVCAGHRASLAHSSVGKQTPSIALLQFVSRGTSVRIRFGSPFSSKRLWFVNSCLVTLSLTINKTFKWLSPLPILIQELLWW